MSSEKLGSAKELLKGNLGGSWDILEGSEGNYTDLGVARRFGGAAAAYSLRDIGAMNGRVVKVRRDLAGEEADPEDDFSANQVQSGALEDWVNGKLESVLPADVATAAAAYSLRKVKASYSGDAVRIRRSSDDIEVDVAFDSDDKVSATSAITNIAEEGGEIGSTTATDIDGFLNEVLTVGVAVEGGNSTERPDSFTNATNSSFTATVTGIAGGYFPYKSNAGDAVTVSFDLVLSGGASPSINTSLGVNTVATRAAGTAYSSSGSYTFTLNCNAEADHIRFADGDDGTFAITNFRVTSHTHQAFVHTWYDQAGSNNAVQETDVNQPKIASSGALLTDGLLFDGSDDFLQTSGQVLTNTYTGARSLYGVCKINTDSGYIFGDAANGTDEGTSFYSDTAADKILFTNGKSGTLTTFDNITTIEGSNFLISSNYIANNSTTIHKNANNNGYTQGTGSYNFNTSSKFTIGDREGGSSAATRFDGSIQEIIAYDSDQTDNRFKIESNINNYYGLYNDANDLAGNFTVDSSGAGTNASISNESKTGFTATVVDKAGFFGADLNEAVPNGSNLYISFNANLSPSGGTAATPNFSLANSADKTGNSTGSPLDTAVVEGFNSITVAGTASTCDRIRFTEGNDDVSFIISDLKISRIARNGFVQTWYDQSGNNRPMIQDNASEQPSIVENGGFVGGVKAKRATSDDTMQNLQVSTNGVSANFGTNDWASGANSKLGLMYVGKIDDVAVSTAQSIIWGGGRGVSSFQSGGLSLQVVKGGDDTYRLTNERQGLTPSTMTTTVTLNTDDDMILYGTADNREFTLKLNSTTATETETADLDTREDQALSLFGAYSGFNTRRYQNSSGGVCKECYLFAGDNISEVDTIATEINQHYNIY